MSLLSVDLTTSFKLLRLFRWCVSDSVEQWFQREGKIRETLGLALCGANPGAAEPDSAAVSDVGNGDVKCGICLELVPSSSMIASRSCGSRHPFCRACYHQYVKSAIKEGPGCLALCCPMPDCKSVLPVEMIRELCAEDGDASESGDGEVMQRRYDRFFSESFVNDNKAIKWCPAPNCGYCVAVPPTSTIGSSDNDAEANLVRCRCGHSWCWQCEMEAHSPVDCNTVQKWIEKNSNESENLNWIIAHSKPCPKCLRRIEKNQGCMHMTCTICRHEFCWLCLRPWSEHNERTGGHYHCNRYDAKKEASGLIKESQRKREAAASSLQRYLHYHERWAEHEKARCKAQQQVDHVEEEVLLELCERLHTPLSQLKFITDALKQVVECRRILKWTYAYGYFLDDNEWAKRNFFEFQQGEAEASLERLHEATEKKLNSLVKKRSKGAGSPDAERTAADAARPSKRREEKEELPEEEEPFDEKAFNDFQCYLTGLTFVTRNFFDKLVAALASGHALDQVESSSSPAGDHSGMEKRMGKSAPA